MAVFAAMISNARRAHSASDAHRELLRQGVRQSRRHGGLRLAPAIVAYQWGVVRIAEYGHFWGRFGWLACFFYAVAAALRLARFNARAAGADKRYFEGLPSPSAAAIVAASCGSSASGTSRDWSG